MDNHYYILVDFKIITSTKIFKKKSIFKFVEFFGVQSKIYNGGMKLKKKCIRSPRLNLGKIYFDKKISYDYLL